MCKICVTEAGVGHLFVIALMGQSWSSVMMSVIESVMGLAMGSAMGSVMRLDYKWSPLTDLQV